MAYRFEGKQKTLSFGAYPAVGLKDARARREEAKAMSAAGVDLGAHKKAVKEAVRAEEHNNYETIAREWHAKYSDVWTDSARIKVLVRQANHIFPDQPPKKWST